MLKKCISLTDNIKDYTIFFLILTRITGNAQMLYRCCR